MQTSGQCSTLPDEMGKYGWEIIEHKSNFAMTEGRKSNVWKPGERRKGDREKIERFQSENLELPLESTVVVEKAMEIANKT